MVRHSEDSEDENDDHVDAMEHAHTTGHGQGRSESTSSMRERMVAALANRGTIDRSTGYASVPSQTPSHSSRSFSKPPEDDEERQAMVHVVQREIRRSRASDSQVATALSALQSVCEDALEAESNGRQGSVSLRDDRLSKCIHPVNGAEKMLSKAGFTLRVKDFERCWVTDGNTGILRKAVNVLEKTLSEMKAHQQSEEVKKQEEQERERERREHLRNQIAGDKKERRVNAPDESR